MLTSTILISCILFDCTTCDANLNASCFLLPAREQLCYAKYLFQIFIADSYYVFQPGIDCLIFQNEIACKPNTIPFDFTSMDYSLSCCALASGARSINPSNFLTMGTFSSIVSVLAENINTQNIHA